MTILLWVVGGLAAWWLFGFCWLRLFVGDETEKDYEEYEGDFGEIVALKKKHGPVVKLRDENHILKNVKLQVKKNQSGIDLLNGRVFQTGDKFS